MSEVPDPRPLGRWVGVATRPRPPPLTSCTHLAWSATFSASQRPCICSISRTLSCSCCSRALAVRLAASRRLEPKFRQAMCRRWAVLAASTRMSARPLGDKGGTPLSLRAACGSAWRLHAGRQGQGLVTGLRQTPPVPFSGEAPPGGISEGRG